MISMRFRKKPKARQKELASGKDPDRDSDPPRPSPQSSSSSSSLSLSSPRRNVKDRLKNGFNATAGALRCKININRKISPHFESAPASLNDSSESEKDLRSLLDLARKPAALPSLPLSRLLSSSVRNGRANLKNAIETTANVLLFSLSVIATSADVFPPLKTAACVLQNVVDHLQACKENREDILQLLTLLAQYVDLLKTVPGLTETSPSAWLQSISSELESDLSAVSSNLTRILEGSTSWTSRLLHHKQHESAVRNARDHLEQVIKVFTVRAHLYEVNAVDRVVKDIDRVYTQITRIRETPGQTTTVMVVYTPPSHGVPLKILAVALFSSVGRLPCVLSPRD